MRRQTTKDKVTRMDSRTLSETPQPASTAWRPIETAPKDGRWMLMQGKAEKTDGWWTLPAIAGWSLYGNCWRSMDGAVVGVTHWMPLPWPPR